MTNSFTHSLLVLLLVATATHVLATPPNICHADNCARGVTGTGKHIKEPLTSRLADCTSVQKLYWGCPEKTTTVTKHTTITLPLGPAKRTVLQEEPFATVTIPQAFPTEESEIRKRNPNPICPLITPSKVPAYATYCHNIKEYKSACSCAGITEKTPPAQHTKTVTSTITKKVCPHAKPTLTPCWGKCFDLEKSEKNCGKCGNDCKAWETCKHGKCTRKCPDGQKFCSGKCTNVDRDPWNCGECGKHCKDGETCKDGKCIRKCPPWQQLCNGRCFNINDPFHCGRCDKRCKDWEKCKDGKCIPKCSAWQQLCNGKCVNINDPFHCGNCWNHCDKDSEKCVDKQCVCKKDNEKKCDGKCTDLQSNNKHCGRCKTECERDQKCENGSCKCRNHWEILCRDKCVDKNKDEQNCGTCGHRCGRDQKCENGTCKCRNHWEILCGDKCVDKNKDEQNCGTCGHRCGQNQKCENGSCKCRNPWETLCRDKCVDKNKDEQNCGTCDHKCGSGKECVRGECKWLPNHKEAADKGNQKSEGQQKGN